MTIQPCFSKVLIQMIVPEGLKIVIPDKINTLSPQAWIKVLAIGPDVTCCKPGDSIIIHPNPNILSIDDKQKIGLIDQSIICAIDTDPQILEA